MDKLEIAKALLTSQDPSFSKGGQTMTAYGIAMSDSADGLVMVNFGGDTVSPDDDQSIEVETTFSVREGDEVIVSLIGADGTGKTPIVIGVIGRGDEQQTEINTATTNAAEALEAAEDAQEAAENAIVSQTNYYILSASLPATPTEASHSGWSTTEPAWAANSTNKLYLSIRTAYGSGTITWSAPAEVQAYANINVAKNAIELSVSETYVSNSDLEDTLDDYSTTTEMNSAIQQSASSITSTVSATYATKTALSETDTKATNAATAASNAQTTASNAQTAATNAQTAINNLEIGGRNLLRETDTIRSATATQWGAWDVLKPSYSGSYLIDLDYGDYVLSFDWTSDTELPEPFGVWVGYGDASGNGRAEMPQSLAGYPYGEGETTGHVIRKFTWPDANDTYPYFACRPFRSKTSNGLTGITFTIRNAKLEKGNQATDWTPAPEDVDSSIALAQANAISTAASDASSKANTAQANAISTAASDATTKANAAQANAISTAASDATSKANTAQANAISAAASDATTKANTARANAISQANSNTQTAINNLEIGGRNLWQSAWSNISTTKSFDLNAWAYTIINSENTLSIIEPSTTYTIHYDLEILEVPSEPLYDTGRIGFYVYGSSYVINWTIAIDEEDFVVGHKESVTMTKTAPSTLPSNTRLLAYTGIFRASGSTVNITAKIRFTNVKIEKGSKATGWTPAPEDVDNSISTAQATAITTAQTYADENKVDIGDSNITELSSTMKQDVSGVSIYNDISAAGDTYAHIDGEAFEIKAVTEAETINSHLDKSVASFGLNRANIAGIDGTKYWAVEDLRTGSGGTATMSQLYYGDSETTDIVISFPFVSVLSVLKNNVVQTVNTDYTVDSTTNSVIFNVAPLVGDSILIVYTTTAPVFAYTNGLRGSGEKGPYSIANGLYNIARGAYSEAHGNLNVANGYSSYVEGYNNIASGEMQRVFGKSNIEDTANQYVEIVGNGEIIAADSTETYLINDETSLTLEHTPEIVNTAYVGKTYLYAEISSALTAHNVRCTYRSQPQYDANGNLIGGWWWTTLKATTPFDYTITFKLKQTSNSQNPKTVTLNAGKTASNEVGISSAGYNNYSVYSATIPTTDVLDYVSVDADEVSLSGPITYFGQEFGDFPLIINYTYAGSMVRGNARTLDWHGNENIAGNYSNPFGIAPVFQLLWVNSAPTSNFAAQMIPLNLSSYDAVCIITKSTASSSYTHWQFGLVGGNMTMTNKGTSSNTQYGRTAEVTTSGITFSNGYNNSTAGAANCVPWYIYGIKGLQTSIQ